MAQLNEYSCRPGARLRNLFTAWEARAVKHFINSFKVVMWNGLDPKVDRSDPYGEYTIYIPRVAGGAFPWSKLAFGYELATVAAATEGEPGTPVVNINAGSIRMHGLRVHTYAPPSNGSELPLLGENCTVFAEVDRNTSAITVAASTVVTASTGSVLRIPLYTFTSSDGGINYALGTIHNMGDINIDQPIR